jgi:hypothetical protein
MMSHTICILIMIKRRLKRNSKVASEKQAY